MFPRGYFCRFFTGGFFGGAYRRVPAVRSIFRGAIFRTISFFRK